MAEALHLLACDADDLKVMSALMQDAAIRVGDIGYDSRTRVRSPASQR